MRVSRYLMVLACLIVVLSTGCSDDGTTSPPEIADPPPQEPILTPDEAVDVLLLAFAERDSAEFDRVLAVDSHVITERNAHVMGTEVLAHDLVELALRRFCRGMTGPIEGIYESVELELDSLSDWQLVENDPRFEGCRVRHYEAVARYVGGYLGRGDGGLSIYVRSQAADDGMELWRVVAIDDWLRPGYWKTESHCLAEFIAGYVPGEIPRAIMTLDHMTRTTEDGFVIDASESDGRVAGLHTEPFAWRVDDDIWSPWQAESSLDVVIDSPGEHRLAGTCQQL